jgi:plasminogen activator inhibitor 1 RNA-binding protein
MAARNANIFAYLDSDDEDVPKVNKKQEQAPTSTPVALNKPAAGNKKTGKKTAPVVEGAEKKERAPRSEGARGGRGGARGGRGGERGGERGERRQFERRSGTGRGKETSKQGGGARNWGNDADKTELSAEAEVQEGAKAASDEEATPAVEEEAAVEEEEEVQFTLDEYLAKKQASRSGELFAEVEVRQIDTDFSGAKQLTKDGKTPDFIESAYEKVYTKKTSGRKKQFITDVGFQAPKPERAPRFEDNNRGDRNDSRGGRGGRGDRGGRGGRAPGGRAPGGRGGRGPAVPNVTDLNAFPSL